jgi:hypothetical protein
MHEFEVQLYVINGIKKERLETLPSLLRIDRTRRGGY